MNKLLHICVLLSLLLMGCNQKNSQNYHIQSEQMKKIEGMINAINEKNAERYAQYFADDVRVFMKSEVRVKGKKELIKNRAQHFKNYPNVRSEIQYLTEIENRVIMHDKVWLTESDEVGKSIVEVFTFKKGKIVKVDVFQPTDLFE